MTTEQTVVPFVFEDALVRTVIRDSEPWFVGKDVASVLGYKDTDQAIRAHCKAVESYPVNSTGQIRNTNIIPERDVYRLIMRSKLPAAEAFENWVVSEVLPSLRKTGRYALPGAESAPGDDMPLNERRLWVDAIALSLRVHGRAAARELWQQSPLPQVAPEVGPIPTTGAQSDAVQESIADFLAACTVAAPKSTINASILFNAYLSWCAVKDFAPVTQSMFGKVLILQGIPRRKRGVMYYDGLSLVPRDQQGGSDGTREVLR